MATVVLVHGAWHGPWCFAKVLDGLAARGVDAVAPELPLLGGLGVDAELVADLVAGIDGPVVLLGHSYGGQVISAAAAGRGTGEGGNVDHLVYLCALMLDEDESLQEVMAGGPNAFDAVKRDGDHRVVIPELAAATFYGDCGPSDIELALRSCRPMPASPPPPPGGAPAWKAIPSTYVVCEQDKAIPPDSQRRLARHATHTVTWDVSHSPFFSRPDLMVDLLADLASGP
ncbi:MAG: alpha/beta hydrolase [Acidimicrobiales bacterium]